MLQCHTFPKSSRQCLFRCSILIDPKIQVSKRHCEPVCHSSCGNVAGIDLKVCGYAGMHLCLIKVCFSPQNKTCSANSLEFLAETLPETSYHSIILPFHKHFATQLTVLKSGAAAHQNQLHIGATVAKPREHSESISANPTNIDSTAWMSRWKLGSQVRISGF